MSQEDIEQFLRIHQVVPNKVLGQNFMVEPAYYPKLANYAALSLSDVVLDAGAGFGFLTRFLADKCHGVVAVEKDPHVAAILRQQVQGLANVSVVEGDVLKTHLPPFNKVVAIPPYYLSSQLVLWLLEQKLDCAVLIVQKEFAQRLNAAVGSEEYGWLTVVASQHAEVALLDAVPKTMFYPPPEVDSIIVSLKPWSKPPFTVNNKAAFIQLAKWLFTQRNKKLAKALAPYLRSHLKMSKPEAEKLADANKFTQRRVRELEPKDFGELSDALSY
jgi:16S rRNA (adenine1518-N6/adenine1519-N6)-dimethyltransferase